MASLFLLSMSVAAIQFGAVPQGAVIGSTIQIPVITPPANPTEFGCFLIKGYKQSDSRVRVELPLSAQVVPLSSLAKVASVTIPNSASLDGYIVKLHLQRGSNRANVCREGVEVGSTAEFAVVRSLPAPVAPGTNAPVSAAPFGSFSLQPLRFTRYDLGQNIYIRLQSATLLGNQPEGQFRACLLDGSRRIEDISYERFKNSGFVPNAEQSSPSFFTVRLYNVNSPNKCAPGNIEARTTRFVVND
jgi:hypothetical protein